MVVTYPLNDIDYGMQDAELFHCTRTSGVFDGDDFTCRATGADNNVTVGEGVGWIRNAKFAGKVVALKEPMVLDMGVADATYPRIDAVALRFDANANKTMVVAIQGRAAANPEAPEVVRTEGVYELHLCHVRREAGATAISVGNLTDIRMNEKYCGLMQDDVTPRGSAITAEQLPVVPVSKGGTGGNTAAEARKNLGAISADDIKAKSVDGVNMNTVKTAGKYYGSTMTNAAESGISVFDVEVYSEGWLTQTQKRIQSNGVVSLYIRSFYNGTTWSPWRPILTNILPNSMLSASAPSSGTKNQLHFVEVE